MDTVEVIKEQLSSNKIILYMKGDPNAPQCGFSAKVSQALMACGEKFAYVNILDNPDIRETLKTFSNWPTFPQLYIDGELVGGCDIISDLYEKGELQEMINSSATS